MKTFKTILLFLVLMSMFGTGLIYAQPKIPKENIPKDIPEDLANCIEGLYSEDPIGRAYACRAISMWGEDPVKRKQAKAAVPFLIDMLGDDVDLEWRIRGGGWTGEYTSPAGEAITALELIGESSVEPLIEALKNNDEWIRSNSARVLGDMREARAVEALIVVLRNDPWGWARKYAAEALGKIKDPRSVESLIEAALKDENWNIRVEAERALGEIGDARAVAPLITLLTDIHHDIHHSSDELEEAAIALGKIKDPSAIKPLIDVLAFNWGEELRHDFVSALKAITNQDFGDDQAKWQEWWEKNKEKF